MINRFNLLVEQARLLYPGQRLSYRELDETLDMGGPLCFYYYRTSQIAPLDRWVKLIDFVANKRFVRTGKKDGRTRKFKIVDREKGFVPGV